MRIDVIGFGSRGDAQPMAALVRGLVGAGHEARLISHSNFAALAERHGLDFAPIEVDSQGIVESAAGRAWLAGGPAARPFLSRFAELISDTMSITFRDVWAAMEGDPPDMIVANGTAVLVAASVAEKLGVPCVRADFQPRELTRAFPATFVGPAPAWLRAIRGEGLYNLASHAWSGLEVWRGTREATNRARADVLGLPPWGWAGPYGLRERQREQILCAFSEVVVPRPFEWGDNVHVTGFWTLPASPSWSPSEDLISFLDAGPRPICVTFGSMLGPDPRATTTAVLGAIERIGRRAILVSGWGGLAEAELPPGVIRIDSAPFEWLFEQVSTVVHHAGAGTTGAALRAGRPSVAVPLYADQPFWANRIHALGAGPAPLPMQSLQAEPLAQAIETAIMDRDIVAAAAEIGEQIRTEDGIDAAVRVIEAQASASPYSTVSGWKSDQANQKTLVDGI